MTEAAINPATLARFWAKVDRAGPVARPDLDPCWIWTAGTTGKGYGYFKVRSYVMVLAHRFSWEAHFGPIPAGKLVCHHCDTPPCVRPSHLYVGTHAINSRDASARHRLWMQTHPGVFRGEGHPRAKLTAAQVAAIRSRIASNGGVRGLGPTLAKEYGVSKELIYAINNQRIWKE